MKLFLQVFLFISILSFIYSFSSNKFLGSRIINKSKNGVNSLKCVLDVFAGLALSNQLNNAQVNPNFLSSSMPIAAVEVKQGNFHFNLI